MLDREHHDSRSQQSTDSHFREHFVLGALAAGQTPQDPLLHGPLLRGVRLWPPRAGRGQAPSCLRGARLRPPQVGGREEGQHPLLPVLGPVPRSDP